MNQGKLDANGNQSGSPPLPIQNAASRIEAAVEAGRIVQISTQARNHEPAYIILSKALHECMRLAEQGGWPQVPSGTALKPSMNDPRVAIIRKRLSITGEFEPLTTDDSDQYDQLVEAAVRTFQSRHGIDVDDIIGLPSFVRWTSRLRLVQIKSGAIWKGPAGSPESCERRNIRSSSISPVFI